MNQILKLIYRCRNKSPGSTKHDETIRSVNFSRSQTKNDFLSLATESEINRRMTGEID